MSWLQDAIRIGEEERARQKRIMPKSCALHIVLDKPQVSHWKIDGNIFTRDGAINDLSDTIATSYVDLAEATEQEYLAQKAEQVINDIRRRSTR